MDAMISWQAFAIDGGLVAAYFVTKGNVAIDHGCGTVWLRESRGPLLLMIVVFLITYIVTAALVRTPLNLHDALFVDSVCALYGLFNGLFLGRPLRIAMFYKGAEMAV